MWAWSPIGTVEDQEWRVPAVVEIQKTGQCAVIQTPEGNRACWVKVRSEDWTTFHYGEGDGLVSTWSR